MDHRYRRWLDRKTVERCLKNLTRNGFDARFVPTPDDIQALCDRYGSPDAMQNIRFLYECEHSN